MLGERIGELNGQTIGTRILTDEGRGPRMEVTDHATGVLYGIQVTSTVTYIGTLRPNGTITGEGTGFVLTADGHSANFRGTGVGTFTRPGAISWRGAALRGHKHAATCRYLFDLGGSTHAVAVERQEGERVSVRTVPMPAALILPPAAARCLAGPAAGWGALRASLPV